MEPFYVHPRNYTDTIENSAYNFSARESTATNTPDLSSSPEEDFVRQKMDLRKKRLKQK